MKTSLIITLAAALAVTSPLAAQPVGAGANKTVLMKLSPQTHSSTVTGSVKGKETIDYIVSGKQGQTMSVLLDAKGPPSYYNVMPKGGNMALYSSAKDGANFTGPLPKTGDYIIRVYLMPKEANAGAVSNFSLRATILDNQY